MGLDITAYSSCKVEKESPSVEAVENCWVERIFVAHDMHAERLTPLKDGDYIDVRFCDSYGFRAGSYGSYNRWRDLLSTLFTGAPAETVWANPGQYRDRPFYELVNFSDCEGMIGPECSERLRQAFFEHWDKAREAMDEYDFAKYRDWTAAFTIAAGKGFVSFH